MKINTFTVVPSLPERLKHLEDLANNMWWCWTPEALGLFQRVDRDLWNKTHHNPVEILGEVSQERLQELASDEGFVAHLDRTWERFQKYLTNGAWFHRNHAENGDLSVAYFSAEYGISESVPVYSGGLGVLSGDHLKASSDLGIPLTAVGLLYRQGYFRQYLNADGWQQEVYPENDFYNLPVTLLENEDGTPLNIQVEYPGHVVHAQIWQLMVGRTRLLLLDTNLPSNAPDDQDITAQLYGGGHDMRVKQEILMGIGGIRALKAAGVEPSIYHMNEGHSAFLGLERIRVLMEEKSVDFDTALQAVRASNCFTTHTPVAAGNDAFAPETITYFFKEYVQRLGISIERFLGLGRQNRGDQHEHFSMTVLALRLAAHCNGVSQLHGKVSRNMWIGVYPGVTEDEVPIKAITNGIHTPTWISHEMSNLYDRYLGPDWAEDPTNAKTWDLADRIPEAELWRTHERRRERLVAFARQRLREQLERRGAPQREIEQAEEVLDPEALTIGFARRFALYKRGTLLLRDKARLRALLTNKEHPIQIIFAGKAHPADTMAKEIIRELVHFMRDPEIRRRIVFLEDYDMNVARYLVQGCDVWLNTPRRPLEASGTSGMKAAANGALNLSVLDGWWVEGYNRQVGWSIGNGEEYDDLELQDSIESQALYDMLEKEVVPVFYGRATDGLPRAWIARMKACIRELSGAFGTARMLNDYVSQAYLPAARSGRKLLENDLEGAKKLSGWVDSMRKNWGEVRLKKVETMEKNELPVGESLPVEVTIQLGKIAPSDVQVQLYHGKLNPKEQITNAMTTVLDFDHSDDGTHCFKGKIATDASGKFGFAVRVLPHNDLMATIFDTELIYWA